MLDHKAPHHEQKGVTSPDVQNNNFAGKINLLTLEESKATITKEQLLLEQAHELLTLPSQENNTSNALDASHIGEGLGFEFHTEKLRDFEPMSFEIEFWSCFFGLPS